MQRQDGEASATRSRYAEDVHLTRNSALILEVGLFYHFCEQHTLTRHFFSCFTTLISMSHVTLAQDGCPHHVIHASCAVCVLILFDPLLCTLHRLSHLPFHSPLSSSSSSMWVGSMRSPLRASANEELGTLPENNPLRDYEPNILDKLPHLRDHRTTHPGILQPHQALVLA